MTRHTSYRDAGVDIDAQDEALGQVRTLVRDTYSPEVLSDLGLFGGLYRASFPDCESPILVTSTDGVGTKLRVAAQMKIHDTVGGDLVNHCVNDILVQGARPLFFLDYFATGKLEPRIMVEVVRGMAIACKENGAALIGGETAEMPGFYAGGEYDVAGFIVGVVDEKHLIDGSKVAEGDVLIGLPSTGLHTNGYSLARKILDDEGVDLQSVREDVGGKVGEMLLQRHQSYLKPLLPLVENDLIHAMAHITGGGITDNLPRVLSDRLDASVRLGSWEVPPLFRYLVSAGGVEQEEALRVFNMGIGMILIVAPDAVAEVTRRLEIARQKFYFVGNVVPGSGTVQYDVPPAGFPSWIE